MPYAGQVAGTLGRAARKLPILSASRRRRRGAGMIRTGDDYRAGLRDGREIWIDGERVADVTTHPAFKPIVDAKARLYDLAHDAAGGPTVSRGGCARRQSRSTGARSGGRSIFISTT